MNALRRGAALAAAATILLMLPLTGSAIAHDHRGHEGDDTPTIYGHRGASGYRPEHTLGSYQLARAWAPTTSSRTSCRPRTACSSCRHETDIGGTTDVSAHPEFADRKTTKVIDGVELDTAGSPRTSRSPS